MKIAKAVITAAGRNQRTLPLQTLIDRDGIQKSVLRIIVEEALSAGVEEICVVVCPGDEAAYADAVGEHAGRLTFVQQTGRWAMPTPSIARGLRRQPAVPAPGRRSSLRQPGPRAARSSSSRWPRPKHARSRRCRPRVRACCPTTARSAAAASPGRQDLYAIEDVIEKPTPTEAEQRLIVPGLRAGHYLCFFGMHVFTPAIMDLLAARIDATGDGSGATFSLRPGRTWRNASVTWRWSGPGGATMSASNTACSRPNWLWRSAARIATKCSPSCSNCWRSAKCTRGEGSRSRLKDARSTST